MSPFAKAKLQFADRIGVGSRTTWFESSYFNDDFANALEFTLPEDPSSVSGQRTIKVLGGLSSGSDRDVYEFSAVAGQQLTVNAISRRVDSDDIGIDPNLSIYDSNGNLIGLSQDIWGGENSFGGGSADEGFISNDAMITNFEFTETGTYFIAVDGASSDSGVYELFVSVENVFNPYHNHGVGVDVNGDGRISPLDALLVMNTLSDFLSPGTVATISAASVPTVKYDVDVNGDTGVSPFDALEVIDYLAAAIADARNGGQGEGPGVISLKDFEVVDFRVFPDLEDGRFLEFETANTGVLTLETPNATGLVEIHRIATDGSQLPTAYLDASNGRIDIDVNAGEIVTVFSEDELPEGVRVTNLVSLSPNGKTVYVAGTEDRDSFTVDASTSNYLLDVKGTSYSYDGNHVTRVFVDGGGERDTIDVYTSSDYDAAYLREDSANIYGDGGYSIFATTIENKTVYSNGGDDFARFFDSAGDDRYVAHPDSARLSLAGVYFSEVQDFAHADARATSGGADYAFFYDSAGNDQYRATPVYAYMTGDGYYNYANGFERNYGFAESGGNDTAFLIASSGADHYFGRNDMGFLEGEDYYNYQRGFDTVHLNGLAGGLNTLDEDDLDYVLNLQGNWI
ncbi:MAG: dockerin type I domain-containing protein [Planctomycetota bacterium]